MFEDERTELLEKIEDYVDRKRYADLRDLLLPLEAADIAQLFAELEEKALPLAFRLLPKEQAAEVFVELDSDQQEMLIQGFSNTELKEVLDELYLDDTVDIVEEMPAGVVKRILRHSDPEMRKSINEILKYPEDSTGSIMTTEFVDLKATMTVEDAFKRIRRTGLDKETINICYVTDERRHLTGLLSIRTLLLADEDDVIGDIMETNLISVQTLDDQETTARSLSKYNFLALPVVDTENRLVGIVTVDDAMDVLQEEVTEDIELMAAILPSDKPYLKTGVLETWKARTPWLLILMLSATFTGIILTHFESSLSACAILTAFIPMLSGTGGNSGTQASTAVIRALSLGEVRFSDLLRVLWKEFRVSLCCGACLAAANFVKMMVVDRWLMNNPEVTAPVALVVCCTLVGTVLCAKLVGCSLPLLAEKAGFDPAVMASPFISTIVDSISLLIYFQFATALLGI
ncbi:magnesium transporter [Dysosmobacter sp.]|uniref:magnesium transporter n=1 Tax=Dysosmobacter sp. TaxID=2591382 RepID=UPI002A9BE476|nr:magnesium transporter [Dysosmobacter sp.]MCI6054411.1 magnesium transporter [Dysosmobacter sp.]MDY5511299.1 magnesium transporter [Dysosmobacter sp.]